jgi:hypothetical protein
MQLFNPSSSLLPTSVPSLPEASQNSTSDLGAIGLTLIVCLVASILVAAVAIFVFRRISTIPSDGFRKRLSKEKSQLLELTSLGSTAGHSEMTQESPKLPIMNPILLEDYIIPFPMRRNQTPGSLPWHPYQYPQYPLSEAFFYPSLNANAFYVPHHSYTDQIEESHDPVIVSIEKSS